MDINKQKGKHTVKGGQTIIGKIFTYQKETGTSLKEVMSMPYIQFVLGMLDVVQIDYDSKETRDTYEPDTGHAEINAVITALK